MFNTDLHRILNLILIAFICVLCTTFAHLFYSLQIMIKVNQHQKKKKKASRPIDDRKAYTLNDIIQVPLRLLCDPKYFWHLAAILLLGEFVLNTLIIHKVACKVWSVCYCFIFKENVLTGFYSLH